MKTFIYIKTFIKTKKNQIKNLSKINCKFVFVLILITNSILFSQNTNETNSNNTTRSYLQAHLKTQIFIFHYG